MKRASVLLLALLVCLVAPRAPAVQPMKVTFIRASTPGPWADELLAAMQAAAEDLGVDLSVYEAGHWPGETLTRVRGLLNGPDRPDYLVVSVHRAIGARVIELAEQARVPVFVLNAGLLEKERTRYGGPREHFRYWIGQMLPDDEKAGYELANRLVDEALRRKQVAPDGRVHLIALGGTPVDQATVEREKGLRRAVSERDDAILLQLVSAEWSFEEAARKTPLLLRRYPEATVIWAASDAMALGALASLHPLGREPGTHILVGGANWEPRALEAVRRGEMVATVDGHFLEGAWVMVLLYDHHHGLDFARERVDWRSEMLLITRENQARCLQFLRDSRRWEAVDFRAFSK
ncbi:ABC transporter substrate-binding protein, partial [Archangium sp.]|uniref:ABC transporter substrate-binding protein n=1 Tax=Archangium sp. TaxID=1872627 RepID=UPI002ED82649